MRASSYLSTMEKGCVVWFEIKIFHSGHSPKHWGKKYLKFHSPCSHHLASLTLTPFKYQPNESESLLETTKKKTRLIHFNTISLSYKTKIPMPTWFSISDFKYKIFIWQAKKTFSSINLLPFFTWTQPGMLRVLVLAFFFPLPIAWTCSPVVFIDRAVNYCNYYDLILNDWQSYEVRDLCVVHYWSPDSIIQRNFSSSLASHNFSFR